MGEVLHVADDALEQLGGQHGQPDGAQAGVAPGQHEGQDRECHEGPHRPGVDLGGPLGVEAVAGGGAVAGVRARAGHDDAERDHDHAQQEDEPGEGVQGAGGDDRGDVVGQVDHAQADQDQGHGRHHVQADHPRVELGEHRHAADHGLRDDAQAHADRQLEQAQRGGAAAEGPPGGDGGGQGDGGQHEGEEPVAELDGAVQALLGGRHVAAGLALRPGRAAEAGLGEAHQRAGPDDHHVRHEVGDGEPAQRAGGGQEVHRKAFRATSRARAAHAARMSRGRGSAAPTEASRSVSPRAPNGVSRSGHWAQSG